MASTGFIARHGLWNAQQRDAAAEVLARVREDRARTVRIGSVDPHGKVRAKSVTAGWISTVLEEGIAFSSAQFEFDSAEQFVNDPFLPAAGPPSGIGVSGLSDMVLVPDPTTFRMLPWAPGTGWMLGDMYAVDGTPVALDSRHVLRRALDELLDDGMTYVVGLEIEFYVTRVVDLKLSPSDLGGQGRPPQPPVVAAMTRGYLYQSEEYLDLVDEFLTAVVDHSVELGMPLRTIETELGPGQFEATFDVLVGMDAADTASLFRSMVKQIAARNGLHATFMAAPGLSGFCPSGWHLHQSLADGAGTNLFAADPGSEQLLTAQGMGFLGGLLEHAREASVFTTPTVNGYRRRRAFSLAPDRATWGHDNRAAMCRVLGGPGQRGSHIENRVGEPAANPYHYLASQIVTGLDGIRRNLDPGPREVRPYVATDRPKLPATLQEAVADLDGSMLLRRSFGDPLIDWMIALKRSELKRFFEAEPQWQAEPDRVTEWEHFEYFTRY